MEEINVINDNEEISQNDLSELYNYALAQRYKQMMSIVKNPMGIISGFIEKNDIHTWLHHPEKNEKRLRDASRYLYEASGQYKRLCKYQPDMLKMAYIISPTSDSEKLDVETRKKKYKTVAKRLDNMNLKTEFNKLLRRATRDGIAFGYAKEDKDLFRIQMLDPDYCRTAYIDSTGCIRFEFDFSYFSRIKNSQRDALLSAYGEEFVEKYDKYKNNRSNRWQEIGENGVCAKYDEDILDYSIPPYIAVLDMLFDIEDYKQLAKAREESGNYNLLGFQIPVNKDGKILMDLGFAKKFIDQASSEIPSTIGVLLSPMEIQKINFAKESNLNNRNAVNDAEEQFWNASGVSELLFGSGKSSANALSKSIIADEINIYPIVRQIERWLNRRLVPTKHKVKLLDVTYFNHSDVFDTLLKAGNTGMPVKTAMASVLGYTPYETLMMAELENNVLEMRDSIYSQPLKSTNTMSSDDIDREGGRPLSDEDDLSPEGEATRINEGNANREG